MNEKIDLTGQVAIVTGSGSGLGRAFAQALAGAGAAVAMTARTEAQLAKTVASGEADALSGCYISIDDDLDKMISRSDEIKRDGLHRLSLRSIN